MAALPAAPRRSFLPFRRRGRPAEAAGRRTSPRKGGGDRNTSLFSFFRPPNIITIKRNAIPSAMSYLWVCRRELVIDFSLFPPLRVRLRMNCLATASCQQLLSPTENAAAIRWPSVSCWPTPCAACWSAVASCCRLRPPVQMQVGHG